MSIRKIYVCDRCGQEGHPLGQRALNFTLPQGWTKVTTFSSERVVHHVSSGFIVHHLCYGCTNLHNTWLKPTNPSGYNFEWHHA